MLFLWVNVFAGLAYLFAEQFKSGVDERHLPWVSNKLEIHCFPCLIDLAFRIELWLRDTFASSDPRGGIENWQTQIGFFCHKWILNKLFKENREFLSSFFNAYMYFRFMSVYLMFHYHYLFFLTYQKYSTFWSMNITDYIYASYKQWLLSAFSVAYWQLACRLPMELASWAPLMCRVGMQRESCSLTYARAGPLFLPEWLE